jgi:hypothetical protein
VYARQVPQTTCDGPPIQLGVLFVPPTRGVTVVVPPPWQYTALQTGEYVGWVRISCVPVVVAVQE